MYKTNKTKVFFLERRVLMGLLGISGLLIIFYMYLVSTTVVDIVVRKELEQELVQAHSHISELEQQYLAQKNVITLSFAYEQGFRDIKEKHFATRRTLLVQAVAENSSQ